MRRAAVVAIILFAAATAWASLPAPRERPPTLEEAANEIAVYRASWTPKPHVAPYWEVIFEGSVLDFEVTNLPTHAGNRMACTRITFEVERGIAGEPDSVIQALTIAFPPGRYPPPGSISSTSTNQVPLPAVGLPGLFFLRRAGQEEAWTNNPARLVFSSGSGSWIENARGLAVYDVVQPPETYDYNRFLQALEAATHVRSLQQLTSEASLIARVAVGRRVDMAVSDREGIHTIRYPITIVQCYRGVLDPGSCAIVLEDRSLTDTQQERYLVDKLQTHQGGEALVFGAKLDNASLRVLPGGVLTIDQGGMVDLGLKAAGDTATVILKPLALIERHLQ